MEKRSQCSISDASPLYDSLMECPDATINHQQSVLRRPILDMKVGYALKVHDISRYQNAAD
jgi:hypothetical protein